MTSSDAARPVSNPSWVKVVTRYNKPDSKMSWIQLSSSILLYFLILFAMYASLSVSYWITLGLSIPAAGMLVRLFIIFHDCGHGSYFRSGKLRDATGLFLGILTFTPYYSWTHSHRIHHETVGNLDKRGVGDVWTLTVAEYEQSSPRKKTAYRLYRNPVSMFGVGPLYIFFISNRFTRKGMNRKDRMGVYITNAGLLFYAVGMSLLIGVKTFILIQFPVVYLAGILGIWMFYVQHQFNPMHWARNENWEYQRVALEGSSYYKLPGILRYFTGNIGFHHIHHLSPMIPNYNLPRCHRENELFSEIRPLRFWPAFKTMTYRLWNEPAQELISFRTLKRRRELRPDRA